MTLVALKDWQAVLLAFTSSLIIAMYFLPKVLKIAYRRHLQDKPGNHKIHNREIPTMGGIGIFLGFSFGLLLAVNGYMKDVTYFMAGLIILFFIGIKDDMITVTPWKKIAAQLLAGLILCIFTPLRFTYFHGFLGIWAIPDWVSYAVTLFLIVIIINAYNLIDGIDGLAASIGIVASVTFGIWAWLSNDTGFAVMSAALTGSLVVYLWFNVTDGKYKIFMGDTGSLVIGFIMVVMAIRFNEINAGNTAYYHLRSSPAISMAILIVPLFDTFRVICIRLLRHQSPLQADKRHLHHLLLRACFSHKQATLTITLGNIFIIVLAFLLDNIGIVPLSIVLLAVCTLLTIPAYLMVAKTENWNWSGYKWWKLITSEKKEVLELQPPEGVLVDTETKARSYAKVRSRTEVEAE